MELFRSTSVASTFGAPLAERLRPRTLDEVMGQPDLVGPEGILRKVVMQGELTSLILWGPPGTGKTTLAHLLAKSLNWHFVALSAVESGVKELRETMQTAEQRRINLGERTVVFVDEIHRFNKSQQDALLPYVERGSFVLIGATTENPSFEVNSALLSRCRVFILQPLSDDALVEILARAQANDPQLRKQAVDLHPESLRLIAAQAGGDARRALNILEFIGATGAVGGERRQITQVELTKLIQKSILYHDKSGDKHYDTISALHKSIRNSDPQATLYWLGRMLEAGEDPLYVARRLVRAASEDIGLADNRALGLALQAKEAIDFLGMPEGALALAQAAVFMALAPKSNSLYSAYKAVQSDIEAGKVYPVPHQLRNAVTAFDRDIGFGKGYKYAHDFSHQLTDMDCLPEPLLGRVYYEPKASGSERKMVEEWYQRLKWAKGANLNEK